MVASPTGPADGVVAVWRHLAETIALVSASREPDDLAPLDVPGAWRTRGRQALAAAGVDPARPVLVVHPGAGGAWKRWPAERFAEVASRLRATGVEVLVHQGPADREAADDLDRRIGPESPRLVEPELPVLAAVLADADAYVGGDSGVSQLAGAVGTAAVILYPAASRQRWEPAEVARRLTSLLTGRPGASRPSSRAAP